MRKKNKIVLVVDNLERLPFFLRLAASIQKYECFFLVYKASVALRLEKLGVKNYEFIKANYRDPKEFIFLDTYESKIRLLSIKKVNELANGLIDFMRLFVKRNEDIAYFVVWNGNFIHEKAILKPVKEEKIEIIYFELANIDGKLQVDNKGVNANSSYSNDKQLLQTLSAPHDSYYIWKEAYLNSKLKAHQVRQSRNKKRLNLWTAYDVFYDFIHGKPIYRVNYLNKVITFFKNRRSSPPFKEPELPREYIFFPLQVKNDTQCILHYEGSIIDALNQAIQLSTEKKLPLVVKPHPAEIDIDFILQTVEKYKGEVFFTMRNTFQLINKAELVVTINSSVGVESLMLNKPVVTLGDCFYKSYTSHDLDKVIHHLFIDIDYFSQEELTKGVFEKYIELRGF